MRTPSAGGTQPGVVDRPVRQHEEVAVEKRYPQAAGSHDVPGERPSRAIVLCAAVAMHVAIHQCVAGG